LCLAYLCVLLKTEDAVQGILYLDAGTKKAFAEEDAASVAKTLAKNPQIKRLAIKVSEVMTELRKTAPSLAVDMSRR
jgi:hypothetical protein